MNDSIIYVLSVYHKPSGGAETLHQLVDSLRNMGKDARIFYVDNFDTNVQPDKFKKYNILVAREIEDSDRNLMIVPETWTEYLYYYINIKKAVWWLSLNFYLYNYPQKHAEIIVKRFMMPKIMTPIVALALKYKQRKKKYYRFTKENINLFYHFYNCEYTRQYLADMEVDESNLVYLCGPLNSRYFDLCELVDIKKKENLVVYNPKKGKYFIKALVQYSRKKNAKVEFVPLEKMDVNEMCNILSRAKVFVDFGEFPGPERIPRECAILKCNIITSLNGSANNTVDIPIPKEYKFEYKKDNIPRVFNKIMDMLNDYENNLNEFDLYREKVKKQPELFKLGVDTLIKITGI